MSISARITGLVTSAVLAFAYQAGVAVADTQLTFAVTGGFQAQPEYFGSQDYEAGVVLGLAPKYLQLNNGKSFGNPDPWAEKQGLVLAPSLRIIGERDADTYSEFTGLDDVDATIELGAGLGYHTENMAVFGAVRRGFGGHEGFAGELGLDLIARPSDKWRVSAGPRIGFGNDEFADTYFGVSTPTADYTAFEAEGGILSAGVALEARYQFNENWGLTGQVEWNQYKNDAADSPIVEGGSDSETRVSIGLTRVIRLNF